MVSYSHLATTMAPHRTQFLLLAALLIPTLVCAADFSGPVVAVLDGDTIDVTRNHHNVRIRLNGIDCPEKECAHFRGEFYATSVCRRNHFCCSDWL